MFFNSKCIVQKLTYLLFVDDQGVKFMYDCATGKQIEGSTGCIMADEMVISQPCTFC